MIINRYPYTDAHELNLDFLLRKMKELEIRFDEYTVVNKITFDGDWRIDRYYTPWSVVMYNNDGYISIKPVPEGIAITNTDYWVKVLDISSDLDYVKKNEYTVINVVEYGADNTGSEDNASIINNLLNDYPGHTFYFEPGVYNFASGIIANHSCKIILNPKATLKAIDTFSTFITLDVDGQREDYVSVFGLKKIDITGGIIDCNKMVDIAIEANYTYHSHIMDVKIIDFNDIGIHLVHGACLLVENCTLFGIDGNSNYGVREDGADNNLIGVSVVNCNVGFRTKNAKLITCTLWVDERGTYAGTCAFENTLRSSYIGCIDDTVETGWRGIGNSLTRLTSCEVINNNAVVIPTAATLIFDTTDANALYQYDQLDISLSAYTFAADLTNITGINLRGYNGLNTPDFRTSKQIIPVINSNVNIDATVADAISENCALEGWFLANSVGNTTAGAGTILTIIGATFRTQIAAVSGNAVKARSSADQGVTWSAWA